MIHTEAALKNLPKHGAVYTGGEDDEGDEGDEEEEEKEEVVG